MSKKSKRLNPNKIPMIVLSIIFASLIGFPFISGFIMNNLSPSMTPNGPDVFDWSSLIVPAIWAGVLLVVGGVEAKFKLARGLFRKVAAAIPAPEYNEDIEGYVDDAVAIERPESRRAVKAREKDVARLRAEGWGELHARHDALVLQWSRYETDVALMIDYPIMADYTDPVVHRVIAAMQKIRTAKMKHEEDSGVDPHESSLNDAVNEFELSFQAAERYARRYGQTKLDPREQRKLSAARSALNIILDGEAPAFEVEAAYKSLRSSLKGIIDVPEKALAQIEAMVRREIVAG